jgi:tol-pal system protein YbgF
LNAQQHVLEDRQQDQARRIVELEARIALLEADARGTRDTVSAQQRPSETIRIGSVRAPVDATNVATVEPEPEQLTATTQNNRRLPSLRLHGRTESKSLAREPLPDVPVVNETLPVVPLPEQRAKEEVARVDPVADYREALRALRERHFDAALTGFAAFLSANPGHALVPNALYWRGEARYAKREYEPALSEFEALLKRFPDNDKAPDALLKVALCHRHLGAEDKAQAAFRRLRATYPNSQAATVATREGST